MKTYTHNYRRDCYYVARLPYTNITVSWPAELFGNLAGFMQLIKLDVPTHEYTAESEFVTTYVQMEPFYARTVADVVAVNKAWGGTLYKGYK